MSTLLKKEYLAWQQRRLKEVLSRFNHAHADRTGLLGNLLLFNWLHREIHPSLRKAVLAIPGWNRPEELTALLLESDDETDYVQNLFSYWLKQPETNQPQQRQTRQWLADYDDQLPQAIEGLLLQWQELQESQIFRYDRIESVRRIQAEQKRTVQKVGGESDQKRMALVDDLPQRFTRPDPFAKIGLIPHMKCPQSCRHCMFVWRKTLKNLPDPTPLFKLINKNSNNILFTGGDLGKHMAELYRAIREMGDVKVFAILLNGSFATSFEETNARFLEIRQAIKSRPNHYKPAQVTLQISFDEYHQEIISDKKGRLSERIPVSWIANLVAVSVHYPEIRFVLLHKQNRLNFSKNLFNIGVFSRLNQALSAIDHSIESIDWQTSPRAKADPVKPDRKGGVIRDVQFTLKGFTHQPIHLMSSTLDAYGRAALIDPSEYINERDYLQQILKNGPPSGERFDTDPMVWYDGSVTLFSAAHVWIGNLFAEGDRVFARYQKDPLLAALERFDPALLDYYSETSNDLESLMNSATGPHHLFHQLCKSARMRLHMTRRLIEKF